MDGFFVPDRTAGADHILYTSGNKQSFSSRREEIAVLHVEQPPAWAGQTRGPRGLDLDMGVGLCMRHEIRDPVRAGCAYTTPSDWSRICSHLDPAAPLWQS